MRTSNRAAAWLAVIVGGGALLFLCVCLMLTVVVWERAQERGVRLFPTPRPAARVAPAAPTPTPRPPAEIKIEPGVDAQAELLTAIYQKVNPSVVNITVRQKITPSEGGDKFFAEGQGSGFVWDKEGHIVTNNHVVAGAAEVDITFANDVTVAAEVIGTDPDSDIAVVKVDVSPDELYPAELGDSDAVQVGERAIAIGNPFGYAGTLTLGIVSAVGRSIPAVTGFQIPEAIQTDAAINPGNSGGPLLNDRGQVIGINSQIRSEVRANSGVGFAVPVNLAKRVVPALIEKGKYEHSWLGISGNAVSLSLAKDLGLSTERGVMIAEVMPGSPADEAGLQPGTRETTYQGRPIKLGGDIIVQIDDQVLSNFDDLLIYLARHTSPGQEVVLTVVRDGQRIEVPVTLGVRPSRSQR